MISFKSTYINSVNIQKIHNNIVTNHKAKVIELDVNSNEDYEIIRDVGLNWEEGKTFATDLFNQFAWQKFCLAKNTPKCNFFLISDGISKPVTSKNVLGVASIYKIDNNTYFIPQLQVNPEHKFNARNRGYKHIGESLIKTIIQKYKNFDFKLYPATPQLEQFFKLLNFKKETGSLSMVLKR